MQNQKKIQCLEEGICYWTMQKKKASFSFWNNRNLGMESTEENILD